MIISPLTSCCNPDVVCLLRDTNWTFKYKLISVFKRVKLMYSRHLSVVAPGAVMTQNFVCVFSSSSLLGGRISCSWTSSDYHWRYFCSFGGSRGNMSTAVFQHK